MIEFIYLLGCMTAIPVVLKAIKELVAKRKCALLPPRPQSKYVVAGVIAVALWPGAVFTNLMKP